MPKDNRAFIETHPDLAKRFNNDLDWLNVYTDYENGKITQRWERNKEGVLVDVTAREKAKEELANAQEELAKLNGTLLSGVKR